MVQNYKLCQNCNNALDLNVSKCPYCGHVVGFDLSNGNDGFVKAIKNIEKSVDKKQQTSGCAKVVLIFVIIQVVGAILSLIFQIISSFF